jgi:hypothetical protein
MNKAIRGSVINGDESGSFVSASREPLPGEAQRLSGTVVSADQVAAAAAKPAEKPKHEPAFTPPQDNPAVPYDEHHGKGGMYVLVDGKRVPADEDGTPKSKK